jgi:spermidine/putrescine-binding protein
MLDAGYDVQKMAPADIRSSVQRLLPVRKDIRTFNTAPIDLMAKGSLCVAMMFSGDALIAARRASDAHTPVRLRYLIPQPGAMMSVDVMAIPRDAPHPGNAHAWINAMMEPATVAQISNETFYLSANRAALPLTTKTLADDPLVNVPAAVKRTLRAKPVLTQEVQRELTQALARFKAAR